MQAQLFRSVALSGKKASYSNPENNVVKNDPVFLKYTIRIFVLPIIQRPSIMINLVLDMIIGNYIIHQTI